MIKKHKLLICMCAAAVGIAACGSRDANDSSAIPTQQETADQEEEISPPKKIRPLTGRRPEKILKTTIPKSRILRKILREITIPRPPRWVPTKG